MDPVEQLRRLRLLCKAVESIILMNPGDGPVHLHEPKVRPSFQPGPGLVDLPRDTPPVLSMMSFEDFCSIFQGLECHFSERDQYGVAWWVEFQGVIITVVDRREATTPESNPSPPLAIKGLVPAPPMEVM